MTTGKNLSKAKKYVTLTVNGQKVEANIENRMTLAEFLREELDLTGTKVGCNRGECGSCTVILDGMAVFSCTAINRKDWRTVSVDDLKFDAGEIENQLLPLLRKEFASMIGRPTEWAKQLFEECRDFFKIILPFSERELEFLDRLLDHGEIEPSLLTSDEELAERIKSKSTHPWNGKQ